MKGNKDERNKPLISVAVVRDASQTDMLEIREGNYSLESHQILAAFSPAPLHSSET